MTNKQRLLSRILHELHGARGWSVVFRAPCNCTVAPIDVLKLQDQSFPLLKAALADWSSYSQSGFLLVKSDDYRIMPHRFYYRIQPEKAIFIQFKT